MPFSLRSVVKGSIFYTSGQVLTKASAFLLIPLYTRYLTPDEYGIFGYLQFILQIMATILMFGFYGAQTRFFYEYKDDLKRIGEFLFSINIWLLAILFPLAALISFWGDSIYSLIGPKEIPFHPFIPLIVWTVVFQIMNQLIISFWMAKKEYLKTAILQIILFVLITGFAVFMVVALKMGVVGKIKGMLYGQIVFFLISYISYAKHFLPKIKWQYIAYSLSFGIPIVVHLLGGVVHNSIDRAILAAKVPVSELGLYTLGYQVGMVMSVVTSSINKAWQPNYFDLMESKDKNKDYHVRRTFNLWIMFIALFCMIGILWGGDILKMITPAYFHGAAKVIPFILLGYFFHGIYFFVSSPIFFFKKTKFLPWLTGSAAGLNIGLNFLLIPYFGIIGAALATTISKFFQAGVCYSFGNKLHNHRYNIVAVLIVSLLMTISIISLFIYIPELHFHLLRIGLFILLMMALYFLYKDNFHDFFYI